VTFDLDRFKHAQEGPGGFTTALAELQSGRKRSHWIWYIFPQLAGLGSSPAAVTYGLNGVAEATAYLHDTVLRDRLLAVTAAVLAQLQRNPAPAVADVMGSSIDSVKLVSSMTLFREIARRIDDAELATRTNAVLQAAERQGFGECDFTLREMAAS